MSAEAARVASGVPAGGRFANQNRTDADIALDALVTGGDSPWEQGTLHPSGGYDKVVTDEQLGNIFYSLDGQLHRLDGPAAILGDGTEEWYYEGALHRDGDQPAYISSTGEREWRQYGTLHRDGDQPAKTSPDGNIEYYMNGQLHRSGGKPALARPDGHTEWRVGGELHRPVEYGPALIESDGTCVYFEHGEKMPQPKKVMRT